MHTSEVTRGGEQEMKLELIRSVWKSYRNKRTRARKKWETADYTSSLCQIAMGKATMISSIKIKLLWDLKIKDAVEREDLYPEMIFLENFPLAQKSFFSNCSFIVLRN